MDIEAYISSGILDLFAAGALTAAERKEVEQMAQQYPEVQAELNQINASLNQYGALHAVTPPAHLKAKVLEAISAHALPHIVANTDDNLNAKVIPFRKADQQAASTAFKWLVAASVTLLLISNGVSLYFYNNWKKTEKRLQLAEISQNQYAQNIEQVQQRLNQNQQALALLSDPATQRIVLEGVAKSPASKVMVYWHRETKGVYLSVESLPVPPANQQYQLWALLDGKPIDAGMLNPGEETYAVQPMKNIAQAQAFAITLEPKGGSSSPTLDQMYVMGTI